MTRILSFISLAALCALQAPSTARAASPEETAVMATVGQFLDAFNKGDVKTMLAAGSPEMSIIDKFPPHEWHGAGAFDKWLSDYDIDARKNGITDGSVALGSPAHVDVTADRAYVVIPADYAYKVNGKPTGEKGSILTVTLRKSPEGWRMTGWAWAKH